MDPLIPQPVKLDIERELKQRLKFFMFIVRPRTDPPIQIKDERVMSMIAYTDLDALAQLAMVVQEMAKIRNLPRDYFDITFYGDNVLIEDILNKVGGISERMPTEFKLPPVAETKPEPVPLEKLEQSKQQFIFNLRYLVAEFVKDKKDKIILESIINKIQ